MGAIRTEVQGGQNVAITPLDDGEWHHVAVVFPEGAEWNSEVIHIVDGEIDDQSGGGDQLVDTLIGPGAEPVSLGRRLQDATAHYFPGALADVRIYDTALDLETIRAIMDGEGLDTITGDFNRDGFLNSPDLDQLTEGMLANDLAYDLNDDGRTDIDDRLVWVRDLKGTWMGDANLDDVFDSTDMVSVFVAGLYETDQPASWTQGDWSGDALFDSSDMVVAFTDGGYEQGPRADAAAVPEPTSIALLVTGLIGVAVYRRRPQPGVATVSLARTTRKPWVGPV